MFDKISRAAEKAATSVSRRKFLGRLGKGALGLAGAVGAVLALPTRGQANPNRQLCCFFDLYSSPCYVYRAVGGSCPCGGLLLGCNDVNRSCVKTRC